MIYNILAQDSGCIMNCDIVLMCPLTVWGLYYVETGDNVCTDANM